MIERACEFSPCRRYRYTLWREWQCQPVWGSCGLPSGHTGQHDAYAKYLMVIGLNPSTADETKDDPTIRKCIGFAERWGFGALCMTNLFAWRDTKPENMKRVLVPEGETIDSETSRNCYWLRKIAGGAGMILAAWGKHGSYRDRAETVRRILHGRKLHALKLNQDGSPMHPLYVPYETKPVLLQP